MVLSPLFVTPEWFYQGSTVFENQRKSKNLDSRLKISGMTAGGDSRQNISGMTEGVDSRLNFRNGKNGKPLRGEGDKVLVHFAE
jgi:hypothetical protein